EQPFLERSSFSAGALASGLLVAAADVDHTVANARFCIRTCRLRQLALVARHLAFLLAFARPFGAGCRAGNSRAGLQFLVCRRLRRQRIGQLETPKSRHDSYLRPYDREPLPVL